MTLTIWVSGKKAKAKYCMGSGSTSRGKNVPLNRNIGVMNNRAGYSRTIMFGVNAVKHIPIQAKSKPAKKAKGIISRAYFRSINPKAAITGTITKAFIVLRVAPQNNSPAITSSIMRGVAIMASNVFW